MAERLLAFRPEDYEQVRKAVRHVLLEMARNKKPRKGQRVPRRSGFIPLRLAKLQSGQTLTGSDATDSALADIYSGSPGSEVKEGVRLYQGRQLESSETVDDTEWLIVGVVDGKWQLVSPRTTGGTSVTIKLAKLSSNLVYGASATADVYEGTPWAETDSGENLTVWRTQLMFSSEVLASGTWVYVVQINGQWEVFAIAEEVRVVTDLRVDGLNLQMNRRLVRVLSANAPSGWTNFATGELCDEPSLVATRQQQFSSKVDSVGFPPGFSPN